MTDARTPAETLRAAADRLDELAAAAKPGPWEQTADDHGRKGVDHGVWSQGECDRGGYGWVVEYASPHATDGPDTAWIAALGPQVAAPLSAWLRAEADCVDSTVVMQSALPKLAEGVEELATGKPSPGWRMRVAVSTADEAVAFALAVLGETPTPDTRED